MLGGTHIIETEYGLVEFIIPKGTKEGDMVTGVYDNNQKGKGKVKIIIPKKLSEQEKRLYQELEKFN